MEVNFTLQQINEVARQLAALAPAHKVFALHGEMGAGKTTLIHAWCKALGVAENVSSPTFSIINQYKDGGGQTIYHMDLYRLRDEEEAIATGVEDCLFSGSICNINNRVNGRQKTKRCRWLANNLFFLVPVKSPSLTT